MHSPIPLVDLGLQTSRVHQEVSAGFARVMETGAFVNGPDVRAFEQEFSAYVGREHCVGLGNGTDALELALRAVGVGTGDHVALPANTFVATAEAVVRAGGVPELVDVDDEHLLMDVAALEDVADRCRAVVPVHLFGQLAPMDGVCAVARRHGLAVVEDAAQCQGAAQVGIPMGGFGDVAATSFYPGKNLGAFGDAGAVVTDRDDVAVRVRLLANHGSDRKYEHPVLGFNSRLDTLQAVVLRAKLARLDEWNKERQEAARYYDDLLEGVPGVRRPSVAAGNEHVWHLYVVRVADRDRVLTELVAAGIGAGIHYPTPVHLTGAFSFLGQPQGRFPVTERAAREMVSLPLYPGITREQQERVVAELVRTSAAQG